jgi:hypothetical protein
VANKSHCSLSVNTAKYFFDTIPIVFLTLFDFFYFAFDNVAYNGTKMLLFGGDSSSSEPSVGMLHILDVRNMIWSKTEGVDPSLGRSSMACAVSGDNFIVWGGE